MILSDCTIVQPVRSSFALSPFTAPDRGTSQTMSSSTVLTSAENAHIDECYAFMVDLVQVAGKVVSAGFAEVTKVVHTKSATWDLVTEYDSRVERLLIDAIAAKYPHHKFVAEETAAENELSDAPTWIIDPIDGTSNFVHGIPILAISVALVVRQVIVVGIVYNPVTGELYRSRKGAGSFLNDQPIRTSAVDTLDNALYVHEVSFIRVERVRAKNIKRIYKFGSLAQGVRSFGCAAMSLAYVARGAVDGTQLDDLKPWDVAAGVLLIVEAGGSVYKTDGSPFDVMQADLVCAGTEKLCRELIDGVAEMEATKMVVE